MGKVIHSFINKQRFIYHTILILSRLREYHMAMYHYRLFSLLDIISRDSLMISSWGLLVKKIILGRLKIVLNRSIYLPFQKYNKGPWKALARLAQTHRIKVDFKASKIIFRTCNYQEPIIRESLDIIANKETVNVLLYDMNAVKKALIHDR